MRRKIAGFVAAAAVILSAALPADAAVVSASGAAEIIAPPAAVGDGATESSTKVRLFNERQLNLTAAVTLSFFNANGALVPRTLNTGLCVQSHLVHFDEVNARPAVLTGAAVFDMEIVAVLPTNLNILGVRLLDSTDAAFGLLGTTYPAAGSNGRGLEIFLGGDSLSYSAAQPNRLGFTLNTDGFDQLRVLTACAPDPVVPESSFVLLLPVSGAVVVGGWMLMLRRRSGWLSPW